MTPANPLVGAWRLESYALKSEEGTVRYPLGERPLGFLLYEASGVMSVTLTRPDRPRFVSDDLFLSTPEERAEAFDTYFAYSGTYSVQADRVTHHIEVCTFPNWNGRDQVRFFSLTAGTLTLTAPPQTLDGVARVATLLWKRA